ncbi:histone deacetylase 6 isoform X1 [Conger conger]|uniref:histone deacetylase 6 isoform X1 n=1 Tax=Conger conger TaxID=82655 RepID=UPI002A5AB195|nr:histone deacetylase 6 isoform X1 [Conger conger]XP_061113821.1 histone deacetylase 6 isoform X1 [Conger conger]
MDSNPDPPGSRVLRGSVRSPRSPDSMSKKKSNKPASKKQSLQEARKKGRMDRSKGEDEMINQLKDLDLRSKPKATGTGLVYSDAFSRFHCLWDSSHPECPERVTTVMEQLEKEGLLSRCVRVEARTATEDELLLVHTKEYIELMKSTPKMAESELRMLSDTYDSIYIHPESFLCATLAAGSVLELIDKVMTSDLRNGFSVARPPGHHAHVDKMNGYSMFNNLAIAARYAQRRHGLERVLIVDWDVHHGQGIQYIFEEDPSVLYFSMHRYEEGSFWPHLPESDSSAVGTGDGQGYNINVPWNRIGMKDGDYISAFQQLLLPVAYEFQPQLVLVAAGFDSVIGDFKGEMAASPQCFSVLTHLLQGLAQGRLVLALEGGYNLQSTADGVCASVRSLLGDSCPPLESPGAPSESALKSISQTISALYPFWTSLQVLEGGLLAEGDPMTLTVQNRPSEGLWERPAQITGLVYDQRMMEHHNMWDSHHPELPQRISRIFSRHEDLGLVSRCLRIPARLATEEELAMCHSPEHIARIKSTEGMKPRDLHRLGKEYNSIYISAESYRSALLAAGACFNAAQALMTAQVRNAVAIVRPPGHHAEKDAACGFCFFNTAALTARYAQTLAQRPLRVLILDWDIHHGNGTQHMFEEDDSVLYISLHRYDNGLFFPSSYDADFDRVGQGKGRGFNVNIPWNGGKMGDSEYLAAFHTVVMPIARQFDPELVLVSAGFDAARGDPLGGYQVTPEGYAHLTHLLMSLAAGRVLLILEGGYNLTSISDSMSMCTSVLLGDLPPSLPTLPPPQLKAEIAINSVLRTHAPYWSSLRIQIPESLCLSLPSPRGKRTSAGKGKKYPKKGTPARTPGQECPPITPQPEVAASPALPPVGQEEECLQDITQGLLSLDLDQPASASHSPASVPVGGARPKVKPAPHPSPAGAEKSPAQVFPGKREGEEGVPGVSLQQQSGEQSYPEPASSAAAVGAQESTALDGASGWSKPSNDQPVFELFCGAQNMDGETMFVVEPLSWCPHLEAVGPLPAGKIDVFLPCEDCGTDAENWICLCCYKVFCGRYVNQHMVTHGLVTEHPLVLSFSDLSVWCYACEAYVHNKVLYEARNAAHQSKFGEDIPD